MKVELRSRLVLWTDTPERGFVAHRLGNARSRDSGGLEDVSI